MQASYLDRSEFESVPLDFVTEESAEVARMAAVAVSFIIVS